MTPGMVAVPSHCATQDQARRSTKRELSTYLIVWGPKGQHKVWDAAYRDGERRYRGLDGYTRFGAIRDLVRNIRRGFDQYEAAKHPVVRVESYLASR